MPRGPRIQFEGALYHVINRGNYKAPVFADDSTKAAFVACLIEGCEQAGWILHAYVVMRNHFHLAIETPRPNLAAGMQWLQSTFATRFNRFRAVQGHLFQGRYKALLVEPGPSLARVVHYLHLNPVRARIVAANALASYPWSSFDALRKFPRPAALSCGRWLAELGVVDNPSGWEAYRRYLEWLAVDASVQATERKKLTHGWAIGSPSWKRATANQHRSNVGRHVLHRHQLIELNESEWLNALNSFMKTAGLSLAELNALPKSAPQKLEIAWKLRASSFVTNQWIAHTLRMGNASSVSSLLSRKRSSLRANFG